MPRSTIPAALAAAVAAVTVTVLPGAAGAVASTTAPSTTTPSTTTPSEPGPGLERACLRIPNIETRTANLVERLQGDATVRGSLLWLQAQIDKAAARNRQDLVEVLQNRLAVRQQTLEVLQLRQQSLPQLRQFCIERGVAI
jgi:hypothetical protein